METKEESDARNKDMEQFNKFYEDKMEYKISKEKIKILKQMCGDCIKNKYCDKTIKRTIMCGENNG